jgi:hypothetical protein
VRAVLLTLCLEILPLNVVRTKIQIYMCTKKEHYVHKGHSHFISGGAVLVSSPEQAS